MQNVPTHINRGQATSLSRFVLFHAGASELSQADGGRRSPCMLVQAASVSQSKPGTTPLALTDVQSRLLSLFLGIGGSTFEAVISEIAEQAFTAGCKAGVQLSELQDLRRFK